MDFAELKQTVIDNGLCARCGVCVGVCPVNAISFDGERFPILNGRCTACGLCNKSCPGGDVDFPELSRTVFDAGYDPSDLEGYTENLHVAHPVEREVRYSGASGGMVTGLLLYLLEKKEIDGALVVDYDPADPLSTKGILATTPEQIRRSAQSKYCVTPSMDVLGEVRKKKGRYAVVALPCQIHGLRKMQQADKALGKKIAYIFGLYCNCTLKPNGHLEAIKACGIPLSEAAGFGFRGAGWPGGFVVHKKDGTQVPLHKINIKNVMNVMFRLFGAERCYLCVDALAEYADLSFGDFWAFDYKEDLAKLERCTLISQRTPVGKTLLQRAVEDGAIVVHDLPKENMSKRILKMAQGKRGRNGVRYIRMKKTGKPVPDYHTVLPEPTRNARVSEFLYRSWFIFRGKLGRSVILKILFSPLGDFLDAINEKRKRKLGGYDSN